MMKIKKLLFYSLLVPFMFVTLMSDHCILHTDNKGRPFRMFYVPEFGEKQRCGGGAGGYEWDYEFTVYSLEDGKDPEVFSTKKATEVFGVTSPLWMTLDVPTTGKFKIEAYAISTLCYSNAINSASCPSRCAKLKRLEYTPVYDHWDTESHSVLSRDLHGPCC